ncbi:IQ and ubiquitin-like domain-containing protein [Oryzias melastigma]|uniref:IQ and ubiquitin-like domain-containing protein n=1 Tax=Oryzias melastigma TaxID=30732 RepID=A0A834BUR1_ORYME|nr:IQ and ubiquitin-like domain-containing protein [Oryzias melastigma]KAF6717715.1 IQ and ubiquitin-like domain-containing protein [Oryzias melastigma]
MEQSQIVQECAKREEVDVKADPQPCKVGSLEPPVRTREPARDGEQVLPGEAETPPDCGRNKFVIVEHSFKQKPFLGGYRHQLTKTEYHHAAVQTIPRKKPDRGVTVFSRDTQTVQLKSHNQQCPVNSSTQMTGIGCYVSCMNDKLVTPRKYITADEWHDRRLKAVIFLQSLVRRWLAQKALDLLRDEQSRRLAWLEMQERRREEEKEEQLKDLQQRRMNPKTKEDFNLLYKALEMWRLEEERLINSSQQGAQRKTALRSLLEKEMQLISAIGRHQIFTQTTNYEEMIRDFLNKSASPYRWHTSNNQLIEMDTPHTIRARKLQDLYNNISLSTVSQEQRLQLLMTLKETVEENKCPLTLDIVELIDREVDLMRRGIKAQNLNGLRKRICTLFLQYIKTATFNPIVSKMLKVYQDPSQLKNDMFLCHGCRCCLPSAAYNTSGGLSRWCQRCTSLDNIARRRLDFSIYKNILKRLKMDEQKLNKEAKIPWLLQEEDMWYLVEVVWASRSALNGKSDLYNLVFVRWDKQRDWSPWNCLLLSKEETLAHSEVKDVTKVYEKVFIREVEHKHEMARQHFSRISVLAEYLDSPSPADPH